MDLGCFCYFKKKLKKKSKKKKPHNSCVIVGMEILERKLFLYVLKMYNIAFEELYILLRTMHKLYVLVQNLSLQLANTFELPVAKPQEVEINSHHTRVIYNLCWNLSTRDLDASFFWVYLV